MIVTLWKKQYVYAVNMRSIFYMLLFLGGAQGLLLSLALFSVRRGNRKANRILGILLLLFSFLIISHAIGHTYGHEQLHFSYMHRWMVHAILLLVGPLLFLYSKALTQFDFRLQARDSLHLIPSILSSIIILYLGDVPRSKEFTAAVDATLLVLITLQMLTYLICMLFILKNYTKEIQDTYSSLEKINLHWLQFFVISQIIMWSIAFVVDIGWHDTGDIGFIWLLVSLFMYLIGYFGLLQPEIFSGELKGEKLQAPSGKKKYEKSTLSPEQAEKIHKRLLSFMELSKPYINPTLTLSALSKEMNLSPHHLSQVINERLNKNFFEFINQFRIEEAKQLLIDPQKRHLNLAALGFEAGFNSVSSFNSIFKKVTSFTPSQYQQFNSKTTEN